MTLLIALKSDDLTTPFCLLSDGHTDSDILMKWKNPMIEIGNKEMAQFSVGDAVLTTKMNSYSSGKNSSGLVSQHEILKLRPI